VNVIAYFAALAALALTSSSGETTVTSARW
jgi:hypothetical protein